MNIFFPLLGLSWKTKICRAEELRPHCLASNTKPVKGVCRKLSAKIGLNKWMNERTSEWMNENNNLLLVGLFQKDNFF